MNSAKWQDIKSTQRNQLHSYTKNEATEREIKESIPFTVAQKTIKYLGINLTKEVRNLYTEDYRKLMKDIEEDTRKWKKIPCSWIGRKILLKCQHYPKQSTYSMQFLSK